MERLSPHHFALVAVLAFTGLRFCHASALRWEDIDAEKGMLRVVRKNIRGRVGPVSRKKRTPREYPLHPLCRTFNDLTRRTGVDGVVIKSLTGHVTEKMRNHYSTVGLDEKLVAVSSVHRLVPLGSGDAGGDANAAQKKAGEG